MNNIRKKFGRKIDAAIVTASSDESVSAPAEEVEHGPMENPGSGVISAEWTDGGGTPLNAEAVVPSYDRLDHGKAEKTNPNSTSKNADLYKKVKSFVQEHMLDLENIWQIPKKKIRIEVEEELRELLHSEFFGQRSTVEETEAMIIRILDDILELGPLTPLLKDSGITDIFVNGPNEIWIEKFGRISKSKTIFDDDRHLFQVIQRIASQNHRHVDEATPILDTRLVDGSRVNIVLPPVAFRAPSISIRRFTHKGFTLNNLLETQSMSKEMALFLSVIIKLKKNILISGGTGSGKTTMLGAMTRLFHDEDRIVTIEDTSELEIFQPNWVGLECRQSNTEGKGEITIRELLRNALRMRPDRIIIGEVRGIEASDLLEAMNTGHNGCIGTIHANSPGDAIQRFESMICMDTRYLPGISTRKQIASVIDVVVQMTRGKDGIRQVSKISEIVKSEGEKVFLQDLFRLNPFRNGSKDIPGEHQFQKMNARPQCLLFEGSVSYMTRRETEYLQKNSGQSDSEIELLTNEKRPILIVDDDLTLLKFYEASLAKIFQVHTAAGGEQALTILDEEGPFSLIISDMVMPEMDGVTFLSKCKRQFPRSVRIMLTGKGNVETLERAINEAGISQYLTKPLKSEILIKTLEELESPLNTTGVH